MVRPIAENDVFHAVSCGTRRRIMELLTDGERPVGELVDALAIRQPSVSEQLRVLREAGLVQMRKDGRRRLYRLDAAQVKTVAEWAASFSRFWDQKLDALADYLHKQKTKAE